MDDPSPPSRRKRAFADAAIAGSLLIGCLIRLRVHAASPLPSDTPVRWFVLAFAADVAVFGLAGAALFALLRRGRDSVFLAAFGATCFVLSLASLLWSEALVYFGHPPRAADLRIAARLSFFRYSLDRQSASRLAVFVLLFAGVLVFAAARSRRARIAWSNGVRLLLAAIAGLGVGVLPLRAHLPDTARHPVWLLPGLVGSSPERSAAARRPEGASEFSDLSVRELAGSSRDRAYVSDRFPLAHAAPQRSPSSPRLSQGLRPNVVFVVLEGVRAHDVGAYTPRDPSLTPRLDRLAREGIRIPRVYSPGTHTPEGELALWYGLLAIPRGPVLSLQPDVALTGLPEFLRAAGWRSFLWIHDSDQTFYGEDRFFRPRGFRTIDGRDFSPSDPRTSWGFSDRALARHAVTAFDRLEEPFAAMMLTISNHHPFTLPPDAGPAIDLPVPEERGFFDLSGWNLLVGRQTGRMLRTVRYTDEALGDFFDLARVRPWYGHTLFVIASDHGQPIAPEHGVPTLHEFTELRHRVPLVFFSPLLPRGSAAEVPASLADVPATLLGLLGISSARADVGEDLLDRGARDPERPVISWNDEARLVTVRTERRVYHARFPAGSFSRPEEELLIDSETDPEGRRNLAETEPATIERLRHTASVYLDAYPRIVVEGRSGLPPSVSGAGAAPARSPGSSSTAPE